MANTKITADNIAANAITASSITDGTITAAKLAANSVDSDQYVDGSIDLIHMSVNSIDSDQYVDGSIDTVHIADGAITSAKLDTNIAVGGTLTVTGDANFDSNTLFVDASANAVGIGTSSPATRLDIQGVGGGATSPMVTATTGTNYIGWKSINTGGSFWTAIDNSTGSGFSTGTAYARVLWSNGAYPMVFSTNSTERLRIDASGGLITKPAAGGHAVFNEDGVDADFRVESNDNANMLFVDGGLNIVSVGSSSVYQSGALEVFAQSDTSSQGVSINGASSATSFRLYTVGDVAKIGRGGDNPAISISTSNAVTINENSLNADFRVETDGADYAFFVDGSTNNIGIQSGTEWAIVGGGNGTSSSGSSIDMGYDATIYGGSAYWAGGLDIGTNFWRDASGYHYKRTSRQATAYQQNSQGGSHAFYSQTSGNAGAVISWNSLLYMDRTQTVFNDGGVDADFRVESDNLANALFIDGSNGEVMFGKNIFGVATVGAGIRGTTGESFCSISTGNTLHVYDTSAGTFRFYVGVAGGISNYSANNVNLSDEREKKNVEALPSQWDCLKHWDLKQFHYNADDDALPKKYGVIAQEIEAHCPEVIDVFKVDDDTERMGVKEQQMMWMAIKALQEAQTRIETLETRLETLENA
jgi:hypothetical protein